LRNRTLQVRLALALAAAAALFLAPVITPVWAVPKPVAPKIQTTPVSGVDEVALGSSPPAFDARALRGRQGAAASGEQNQQPPELPRVGAATRPAVLTGELRRDRFAVAGLTWQAGAGASEPIVQLRLREGAGWTEWQPLVAVHGPDPDSPDAKRAGSRVASEPLFSSSADAVQVRVDTADGKAPEGLALLTIDPGTSPADANLTGAPAASARAGVNGPGIYTRPQWGADESLRDCTASYSPTIKVGFVHHTVGSNSYSPSDSAAILRGIYAYHVNGNGWCDVGYSFLVDRFGQIFEGRAGGVDKPVIGAHTGGFNSNSFAVSAMGTFTSAGPPAAMLSSISAVLGWKLGLHGRNIHGTDVLVSAGGGTTQYPAGTSVTLNVVSGHRDVGYTECPGSTLHAQLANLRNLAAGYRNANYRRDEDVYGVLGAYTGSGRFEVHGLSASSGFAQPILAVATKWAAGDPSRWRFFIGSSQGDTRADLIGVKTSGTPSGRAEVHVATWASNYRSTIDVVTPVGAFTPDDQWQVAVGGPSGGDVYFILTRGSGTGTVEVHGLSAASRYTQWGIQTGTALGQVASGRQNRFLVARGSADLYLVMHAATWSGRSELHALSAASGYRDFTEHSVLPVGHTNDADAQWVLGTSAKPDLFFVPTTQTGSARVELHRLSPGSRYTAWTQHSATPYPLIRYPVWQFGFG
jgi:hypothetical protein